MRNIFICECGHKCYDSDMVTAENPFMSSGELISACPECRELDHTMASCCDQVGCNEHSSCGFPTDKGYRRTCGKHYLG